MTRTTSFRRLKGLDALFLYVENERSPLNVIGALELESIGRPPDDFRRVRQQIERRLPELPMLRCRLREIPFGLDHPIWVEDLAFDLDAHLHRAALPAPGGRRELADFVARIAERPLRRDRPLWEMYVVERVARRRFALVAKLHHAIADANGSLRILAGLFDADPSGRPLLPPIGPGETRDPRAPSTLALVASASYGAGARALRAAGQILRTGSAGLRLVQTERLPEPAAPRCLFNRAISARRVVAMGSVPFADVEIVKRSFDTTVNHVVLAACAGALRRYLGRRGEIPRLPLLAAVPRALTGPAGPMDRVGNAVSMVRVRLPVHVADPVQRLRAAREASDEALRRHGILGDQIGPWAEIVSPALLSGASRLYGTFAERLPLCSLMISNVRGPAQPLYCAGARLTTCLPFGPIYDGWGLNLTVMSYAGTLAIGAIACPDAVPDVEAIPRAFVSCVGELRRLAHGAPRSVPGRAARAAQPAALPGREERPAQAPGALAS